jgi:hypothetical protein
MTDPEIYYKVRLEEKGKSPRFEYITRGQAQTRGLLAQALSADAATYVKIGRQNYQLYDQWVRNNRKR